MMKLFNTISKLITLVNVDEKKNLDPQNIKGSSSVVFNTMPKSTEEFLQLRDQIAIKPEGAAALFVLASIQYVQEPTMGRHWLIISTDKEALSPSAASTAYRGYDLCNSADFATKQLIDKPYIPYSYIKGAHSTNQYQPQDASFTITIERVIDAGNGLVKVFVVTSGADTARPMTLRKNTAGVWKGIEYSSLFTAVKPPVSKSQDRDAGDF